MRFASSFSCELLTSLLNYSEADIGVEFEPLNPEVANASFLQECFRFTRPDWVVEFIEGQNGSFGHPRHEMTHGQPSRFVQIEVQEEQAYYQMPVLLDELWDRFSGISIHQLDLGHMADVPIHVVKLDQ